MKQRHVKILWSAGLVAAVILTRVLRIAIGSMGEYLVTMYLIMLFTPLVYGGTAHLLRRASSSNNSSNHEDAANQEQQQQLSATNDNNAIAPQRRQQTRLYFLDNLKVFLTAVVLTHHTQCAFGACGAGSWYLGVGLYENWFTAVSSLIVGLNQAYFMPMFFFISAYFVPTSYDRKGKHDFLRDKFKRLLIPAMLTSFTIIPMSIFVASRTIGQTFVYFPIAGPTWFLFWLLVFNYLYVTIREAASSTPTSMATEHASTSVVASPSGCDNEDPPEEDMEATPAVTVGETPEAEDVTSSDSQHSNKRPIPCFWKRWLYYGAGICGLGMLIFILAVGGGSFYAMPLATGSFVNDLFMFGVGIVARRYDWLVIPDNNHNDENRTSSASSLSVAWPWIYVALLLEITAMVALRYYQEISSNDLVGLLYMILAGVYCVDMILVLLHFFQRWANTLNRFGSVLADAAYTVYLIHPLVVTCGTAVFVEVYNHMQGWDVIQFDDDGNVMSSSQLLGDGDGALALFAGWLVVLIFSHLISWPLAWAIKQLPGFRLIL